MTQETVENSWKDDVPKIQHDERHKEDECWGHSSENPFGIHYIQGSNRDEHKARALFVRKEEERQNKHNQRPKDMSSYGFDHKGDQRVICCV